jgi:HAD superfamily hydrolase (TIGR01509 family)
MLIIFDCDGVLVDSERLVCRVEAELLSAWGWPLTPEQAGREFKSRAFPDIARSIKARLGPSLPETWMYTLAMETAALFQAELTPVRGVRAVLDELERRDVPRCVASQSQLPRVRLSLAVCDLARYFGSGVYTAAMVARPKPAPDLFVHAAERSGFTAAQSIVIEDSPSGVRAAVAAGMRVLGYAADADPQSLAAAGAEVFRDMAELPALIGL